MYKGIRYVVNFTVVLFVLVVVTAGCAPISQPTLTPNHIEPTSSAANPMSDVPVVSVTKLPAAGITDTPNPETGWQVYTLATKLPDSPKQLRLYTQAFPATLPDKKRLNELIAQLQITGKLSIHTSKDEGGEDVMSITGDSVNMRLWSDDPLMFILDSSSQTPDTGTPTKILSPDVRAKTAEAFLSARGLLNFPYIIEPPRLSRDSDHAVRVVPLIDGYPLYDYDPLNGRLLVLFNSDGQVSSVSWRPLKLVVGDFVDIVPATVAWDNFVNGNIPKGNAVGQCWQATVYDPNEPYPAAEPMNSPACVSYGGGPPHPYTTATISDIRLVYFANDLSLGMSPFATSADSPARVVFPMWQFSGTTNDNNELIVLWPATLAH